MVSERICLILVILGLSLRFLAFSFKVSNVMHVNNDRDTYFQSKSLFPWDVLASSLTRNRESWLHYRATCIEMQKETTSLLSLPPYFLLLLLYLFLVFSSTSLLKFRKKLHFSFSRCLFLVKSFSIHHFLFQWLLL